MGEEVSRQELVEATRACLEASEAVRTFFDKYVTFWWAESEEPPPEPKAVVTGAIFGEWRELKAKEEKARQEWERKLRRYVQQRRPIAREYCYLTGPGLEPGTY